MNFNNQDTNSKDVASTAKPKAEHAYHENIASEEEGEEWKLTFGKLMAMLVRE